MTEMQEFGIFITQKKVLDALFVGEPQSLSARRQQDGFYLVGIDTLLLQ
jgi:hypothetical protein